MVFPQPWLGKIKKNMCVKSNMLEKHRKGRLFLFFYFFYAELYHTHFTHNSRKILPSLFNYPYTMYVSKKY